MTLRLVVYAWIASVALVSVPVGAASPSYQGELAAKILGPRKLASTPEGDLFVVDAASRLHRLTRRGDYVGIVLKGVAAVTASPGIVLAALDDGSVAQISPRTGRVLGTVSLGVSEAPAALAFDAASGNLWMAFASGSLQARTLDGVVVHDIAPAAGGTYRLAGIAVDPAGLVWVMQDRTSSGGTAHAYDAGTGELRKSVPVAVRIAGGLSFAGGKMYVSDLFSGTVESLTTDGLSAGAIGSRGTAPGQLNQPASVSFLGNGDLVVANMDSNRLDRFGDGAPLPTCSGDADCDGLTDEWEAANGLDPADATNAFADLDGDGLNDSEEFAYGANPRSSDTDGDGVADGEEVASGFDPRDASDHRPQILADGAGATGPGLVRLSATVHDPVSGRGACSASWRQVAGAPVVLKNANTTSPSFVARTAGAYLFEAVATCGAVASLPTQIEVAVNNVAPRADGGRAVALAAGGQVQLSGHFTSDANADEVAFQWDQLLGAPVVGTVDGKTLSARIDEAGYYVFRLGAIDPAGAEGAAEVPVVVLGKVAPPTAAASSPVVAQAEQTVTLDASASYRGRAATFAWTQLEGAAVVLAGADTPAASFVPPAPGRYVFEVAVAERGLRSPPARVEVYAAPSASVLPVAVASAPATAGVNAAITLDGAGSSAGTGTALTYAWRQVSGPAAGLTRADRAAATAVLFEPGSYEFELAVSDAAAVGVPARVRIEARSPAKPIPVAVATAWPTASVGELVLLDGRASTGAIRHRWTQVEGPWVAVYQGEVASFHALAPGVYGFELEVDDGSVRSAPAKVSVVVMPGNGDDDDDDDDDGNDDDDADDDGTEN